MASAAVGWRLERAIGLVPLSGNIPGLVLEPPLRAVWLRPKLKEAIPNEAKVEWVIGTLPPSDRADMGSELLRAGVRACKSGALTELVELIVSWEATAEEIEDSRTQEGVKDIGRGADPVDIEELERRVASEPRVSASSDWPESD